MWVVNIPEIRERAGVSTAVLGYLLLLIGACALVGMQLVGGLIDRFGSRAVSTIAGLLLSLTLLGPAFAQSLAPLAIGLGLLGFCNGMIDVAQNAQAVEVERTFSRPIMSAFHAFFSFGNLLAAIAGGVMIGLDVDIRVSLSAAALTGVVVILLAKGSLLQVRSVAPTRKAPRTPWTTRVLLLGLLAFALMLSEGVAYDWSTVHLHDSLNATKSVAAWAFGAFAITMTMMRLIADRIVHRIGPVRYVQIAALIGATGMSLVALSPTVPLAIAAWAVFGIGLAGCVPQFFSAAGNVDPSASGTYLARVAGLGYVGLLAGPAIIGILTDWIPLTTAFIVPIICCLAGGLLARTALTTRPAQTPTV